VVRFISLLRCAGWLTPYQEATQKVILSTSRKFKGDPKIGVRAPEGDRTPIFGLLLVVS
jgi:hypothetical protein